MDSRAIDALNTSIDAWDKRVSHDDETGSWTFGLHAVHYLASNGLQITPIPTAEMELDDEKT